MKCGDEDFLAAAVPGKSAQFPGGAIDMVSGYSAVDEGPQRRVIRSVEMRTCLADGAARFTFSGHTGPVSDARVPNPDFGFGPVEFRAWFALRPEDLAVFVESEDARRRLAAQLFAPS